jgi:hypothetical protein
MAPGNARLAGHADRPVVKERLDRSGNAGDPDHRSLCQCRFAVFAHAEQAGIERFVVVFEQRRQDVRVDRAVAGRRAGVLQFSP